MVELEKVQRAIALSKLRINLEHCERRALINANDQSVDLTLLALGAGNELDIRIISSFVGRMNRPVIIYLSEYDEVSELVALRSGVHDVLHPGMSANVIAERIKAAHRLSGWMWSNTRSRVNPLSESPMLHFVVDLNNNELRVGELRIEFTMAEILIIEKLVVHNGDIVHRQDIKNMLEKFLEKSIHERAVDSHIKRIRKKLCKHGLTQMIKTVYGAGYRFVP